MGRTSTDSWPSKYLSTLEGPLTSACLGEGEGRYVSSSQRDLGGLVFPALVLLPFSCRSSTYIRGLDAERKSLPRRASPARHTRKTRWNLPTSCGVEPMVGCFSVISMQFQFFPRLLSTFRSPPPKGDARVSLLSGRNSRWSKRRKQVPSLCSSLITVCAGEDRFRYFCACFARCSFQVSRKGTWLDDKYRRSGVI